MIRLPLNSDKYYWHGFHEIYERLLPETIIGSVVEFGVFKGDSIRWLLEQYPNAEVVGADILPALPEWPASPRVKYVQLDQASEEQVAAVLERPNLALVIEDGSHIPWHQSRCLRLGLAALAPGGTYVLEDIHTSHPTHAYYREEFGNNRGATSLSVLLAIEHARRLGKHLAQGKIFELAGRHFSSQQIQQLDDQIEQVQIFRRSNLPLRCWKCGGSDFKYAALACTCGASLYEEADSMTAVIRKRRI